jgi:hypothetical protein
MFVKRSKIDVFRTNYGISQSAIYRRWFSDFSGVIMSVEDLGNVQYAENRFSDLIV